MGVSLLTNLAQAPGHRMALSGLSGQVQLSTPTVIHLVEAFKNLFLLWTHGKRIFFSDVGLASYLGADRIENSLFHMERFVYQELYAQLSYLYRAQFSFDTYSSRGGVQIPFVVRVKDKPTLAIVIDPTDGASEKSLKGITWFSKLQKQPVIGVVLHNGTSAYVASTGAYCIPYTWIC